MRNVRLASFRLVVFLLLGSALLPVRAEDSEARLSRALLALMDADQRVSEKQPEAAVPLYEEALAILTRLRQDDPDFKPRIVEFRIDDVRQKLEGIRPESAAERAPATVPSAGPNYEELYLQIREQALRDGQRLLDVERRMMELQLVLRERDQMLTEQRNELQELRRRTETLQRDSERDLTDARSEIQSLRRFNTLLQERVTGLEAENEKLTMEIGEAREEEALRQMQVREMEAAAAERLEQQDQALRQAAEEVDALQNRLLERGQESRERQVKIEELQAMIEGFQERLANMERLEDTVIELNRRLNLRNEEFEALQAEVDKMAAAEAARDEAVTAAASAKAAREDAETVAAESKRRYESMKAEQDALVAKLAAALNETRELRQELERSEQRILALEAVSEEELETTSEEELEEEADAGE